jgi:hypothetical protein
LPDNIMKLKQKIVVWAGFAAAMLVTPLAQAGYENYGGGAAAASDSNFTLLSSAWLANGGTRPSGAAQPGSANWSVMGAGLVDASGFDAHSGAATSLLSSLYSGGMDPITAVGMALDTWAAVSGFTNLGLVADGGGNLGAAGAAGGTGHIRVGAIFIDGPSGSNVLAHAYQPGNEAFFGAGGNIAGDMHFDDANVWSDGGGAGTIDFYTVALHELGHALGLGHSTVSGSVMEAFYGGQRRNLTADDIAGIQAIYGPVPEPSTYVLMFAGLLGVAGVARRRAAAAQA